MTKVCRRCNEEKVLGEFYPTKRPYKFGRDLYCKLCTKQKQRDQRAADPTKYKVYQKHGSLRYKLTSLNRHARNRCKARCLPYDIDYTYLLELWNKQEGRCALTNIDMETGSSIPRKPFTVSVDRIEPSRGYTKGNVRLVCLIVNVSLGDFGEEAFRQMAEAYLSRLTLQHDKTSDVDEEEISFTHP